MEAVEKNLSVQTQAFVNVYQEAISSEDCKKIINFINSRVSNTNNAKEYILTPQKNMLLFFPSYIWHKILTNSSNTTRYSLAFNLIPIGQYGSGDSTYNTEWFKS